uniref:Uncharacterized protein n=1 Tax=Anguilla anguilla TaxID=7936 RepID=A0A0E9XAA0_ANGAN
MFITRHVGSVWWRSNTENPDVPEVLLPSNSKIPLPGPATVKPWK